MAATCVLEDHKNSNYVKQNLVALAKLITRPYADTKVIDVAFKFNVDQLRPLTYDSLKKTFPTKLKKPTNNVSIGKQYSSSIRQISSPSHLSQVSRQSSALVGTYHKVVREISTVMNQHLRKLPENGILLLPLRYGNFKTGKGHWILFVVRKMGDTNMLERYDSTPKSKIDVVLESLFYDALRMYDSSGKIYTRTMDYKSDKHALQPVRQPEADAEIKDFFCQTWSLMFIHLVAKGFTFEEISRIVKRWPNPATQEQFFIIRNYNRCWVTRTRQSATQSRVSTKLVKSFDPDICYRILPVPDNVRPTARSLGHISRKPKTKIASARTYGTRSSARTTNEESRKRSRTESVGDRPTKRRK